MAGIISQYSLALGPYEANRPPEKSVGRCSETFQNERRSLLLSITRWTFASHISDEGQRGGRDRTTLIGRGDLLPRTPTLENRGRTWSGIPKSAERPATL